MQRPLHTLLASALLSVPLLAQSGPEDNASPEKQQSFSLQSSAPFPPIILKPGETPAPPQPQGSSLLPLIPEKDSQNSGNAPLAPLGDLPDFDLETRRPDAPRPDGPNRTEEAAVRLSQRILFRVTKSKALLLPEVKAPLEASKRAKSDRELRALLKEHYQLLFAKMATMQPSLSAMIQEQRQTALDSLRQTIGPEAQ